jgi:hypothetical protein
VDENGHIGTIQRHNIVVSTHHSTRKENIYVVKSKQMEIETLKTVFRRIRESHRDPPSHVILTTFSLNPPKLQTNLTEAGIDPSTCYVYFQRYSFRATNAGHAEPAFTGEKRRKALTEFNQIRTFKAFRIRSKQRPVLHQMHLKSALFVYANTLEFVQFSRNLDKQNSEEEEVLYHGLPQRLDTLIKLLKDILERPNRYIRKNGLEADDGYVDDMDNKTDTVMGILNRSLQIYAAEVRNGRYDKAAFMLTQGFNTSIGNEFVSVLRHVKTSGNGLLYKEWKTDQESLLLLHFPYVNNGLETNICDAVIEPLSHGIPEKLKTSVELTYSKTPHLQNFPHESWVCRMTGKGLHHRILWFFLVSCNLTLPSWVPFKREPVSEVDLPRYNLECGVIVFECKNEDSTQFAPPVRDYIQRLMRPSDWTTLTTVKCNSNRTLLPNAVDVVNEYTKQERNALRNNESTCLRHRASCNDLHTGTNWQRLQKAKQCLIKFVLPELVGTSNLMDSPIIRYNYFMRWALYDYIFNDLAKRHPVGRLGTYDDKTARKYFLFQIRDDPSLHPWIKCHNAMVTLSVLVDIFVRWSIAFDCYDGRINATRPLVNNKTVVTLHDAKKDEQMLEDPHQKNRVDCTTYDTLSLLMQSMHSNSYLWWKCPNGHTFYWTPKNMMMRTSACPVCAKYQDISSLYEILQGEAHVKFLTVEFPLLRKLDRDIRAEDAVVDMDANEQGQEQLMEKYRLLMKYDLFFLYRDRYVCAIEFDDASHNNKAQSNENVRLDRPPAAAGQNRRAKADAIKNVLSSAMGIHLMRIWTKNDRPNAKSRLKILVDRFLQGIQANATTIPDTMDDFYARVQLFREKKIRAKRLITSSNNQVNENNANFKKLFPNRQQRPAKFPISFVFATDVPKTAFVQDERRLINEMVEEGKKHPCLQDHPVSLKTEIDKKTIKGYFILLQEWRNEVTVRNDHFKVENANLRYRGRLLDGAKTYNHLGMLGNVEVVDDQNKEVEWYHLEATTIGPWKTIPQKMPTDTLRNKFSSLRTLAKQYVRLKDPTISRQGQGADYPPDQKVDNDRTWPGMENDAHLNRMNPGAPRPRGGARRRRRRVGDGGGGGGGGGGDGGGGGGGDGGGGGGGGDGGGGGGGGGDGGGGDGGGGGGGGGGDGGGDVDDDDDDDEEIQYDDDDIQDDDDNDFYYAKERQLAWSKGWPEKASWALPPNKIAFQHPTRREDGQYDSRAFESARVMNVNPSREFGVVQYEWWIEVKRDDDDAIIYVRESDFQYVKPWKGNANHPPLSDLVKPGQLGKRKVQLNRDIFNSNFDTRTGRPNRR